MTHMEKMGVLLLNVYTIRSMETKKTIAFMTNFQHILEGNLFFPLVTIFRALLAARGKSLLELWVTTFLPD